jgi:hypothetical protein
LTYSKNHSQDHQHADQPIWMAGQSSIGLVALAQLSNRKVKYRQPCAARKRKLTFSVTILLLPFSNSGAIQGRVPRTPPDTIVWCFTLERPRSPTCQVIQHQSMLHHLHCYILYINMSQTSNRIFSTSARKEIFQS